MGGNELTIERAREIGARMLKSGDFSLSKLAKKAGYSTGAWSDYFAGKYSGSVENLDAALIKFIRKIEKISNLYPTKTFKNIQKTIKMSFEYQEMALIYGDAGCGKTEAAKYYTENNRHAVYIRCNPAMRASELLNEILLGIGESKSGFKTNNERISRIIMTLQRVPRAIILDEAEHLPVHTLDMVRAFYDDGCCGLVLMGQEVLDEKLKKGSLHENLNYFRSRIGIKYIAKRSEVEEFDAIVESRGITISGTLLDKLYVWCKEEGELRKLDKILNYAEKIAEWSGNIPVTDNIIERAYDQISGVIDDKE